MVVLGAAAAVSDSEVIASNASSVGVEAGAPATTSLARATIDLGLDSAGQPNGAVCTRVEALAHSLLTELVSKLFLLNKELSLICFNKSTHCRLYLYRSGKMRTDEISRNGRIY